MNNKSGKNAASPYLFVDSKANWHGYKWEPVRDGEMLALLDMLSARMCYNHFQRKHWSGSDYDYNAQLIKYHYMTCFRPDSEIGRLLLSLLG